MYKNIHILVWRVLIGDNAPSVGPLHLSVGLITPYQHNNFPVQKLIIFCKNETYGLISTSRLSNHALVI